MSDRPSLRQPQIDCLAALDRLWPSMVGRLIRVHPSEAALAPQKAIIFVDDEIHARIVSEYLRESGVNCEIAEP